MNVVEELITLLGFEQVGEQQLNSYKNNIKKATSFIQSMAGATSILTGFITGMVAVTNSAVEKQESLANSLGVTTRLLDAMAMVADDVGLSADAMTSYIQKLNDNMGESAAAGKAVSAVADSFKTLGLNYEEISKLSTEDQFLRISDAISKMTDRQQAAAAANNLFGRGAGTYFGQFKKGGANLRELMANLEKYRFQTERGTAGALAFANSMDAVLFTVNSARKEFSGLVGESIAPLLDSFNKWLSANKAIIQSRILDFAKALAFVMKLVLGVVTFVVTVVFTLIDAFGGLENVVKLVTVALALMMAFKIGVWAMAAVSAVSSLSAGFIAFKAILLLTQWQAIATQAAIFLIPLAIGAAITAFVLLMQDIYTSFTGGKSVIGDFVNYISTVFPDAWAVVGDSIGFVVDKVVAFFDAISAVYDKAKAFFGLVGGESAEVVQSIRSKIDGSTPVAGGTSGTGIIKPGMSTSISKGDVNSKTSNNTDQSQTITATIQVQGGPDPKQTGMNVATGLEEQSRRLRRNTTGAVAY